MMLETKSNVGLGGAVLENYLQSLIGRYYKILPLWESGEQSLGIYMQSLRDELIGCKEFVVAIQSDAMFLSLISILQCLIDNPTFSPHRVKREVFQAISLCNKLKAKYAESPKEG